MFKTILPATLNDLQEPEQNIQLNITHSSTIHRIIKGILKEMEI